MLHKIHQTLLEMLRRQFCKEWTNRWISTFLTAKNRIKVTKILWILISQYRLNHSSHQDNRQIIYSKLTWSHNLLFLNNNIWWNQQFLLNRNLIEDVVNKVIFNFSKNRTCIINIQCSCRSTMISMRSCSTTIQLQIKCWIKHQRRDCWWKFETWTIS